MGNRAPRVTRHPKKTFFYNQYVESLPQLEGKTIAITGCTSGTGLVLAQTCGGLGARIVLLNRPSARAEKAQSKLVDLNVDAVSVPCDLQSLESVRKASEELFRQCPSGIDVLCNNAGVMGLPDKATKDGFDVQMQTNHLSHFLLTSLVWPLLVQASVEHGEARVVNHSSGARLAPPNPLMAKYFQRNGGNLGGDGFPGIDKWRRYQQTKLANLMFTYALHDHSQEFAASVLAREDATDEEKKLAEASKNVKSLCAHPGPTDTGLQNKARQAGKLTFMDKYLLGRIISNAHSTEDGTMGICMASVDPTAKSTDFVGPKGNGKSGIAVLLPPERSQADEDLCWTESLAAVGIDPQKFFSLKQTHATSA